MAVALKKKLKTNTPKYIPQKNNYVCFVVDYSSSMGGFRDKVIQLFNENLKSLKENSCKYNIKTYVSLVVFSNSIAIKFSNLDVNLVKELTLQDYLPNGMTALLDGLGESIKLLENSPVNPLDDNSYLIIGLSDGEENTSVTHTSQSIKNKVKNLGKLGNWTVTFNCPIGHKNALLNCGLYLDNIREWEVSNAGLQEMSIVNTSSLGNYYASRSTGVKSLTNFYQVDLGNVTVQDVYKLDNVTNKFKLYTVDKECAIKEFVESKGYDYKEGSCFYELTKKEKVQPTKEVLLMEKNKKDIWGGPKARSLVGIPSTHEVKVDPLNVGKYRVFVLSTSTNRKLVRGTQLAVAV